MREMERKEQHQGFVSFVYRLGYNIFSRHIPKQTQDAHFILLQPVATGDAESKDDNKFISKTK